MGAIKFKIRGIYLNGSLYSVRIRIPKDLLKHYPKGQAYLRQPLKTSIEDQAIRLATPILEKWHREFKELREGKPLPLGVIEAHPIGDDLARAIGHQESIDEVVQDRFYREAEKQAYKYLKSSGKEIKPHDIENVAQHDIYPFMRLDEVLNPAEKRLLVLNGHIRADLRLSDALATYLATYEKGESDSVKKMSKLAINALVKSQGDLLLDDPTKKNPEAISRNRLQLWVKEMVEGGLSTGTAKRRLAQVKAVLTRAALENHIPNIQLLTSKITIPNLGKDVKPRYVPQAQELNSILCTFKDDPLVRLLVYLGCRVAEVQGLLLEELHLDHTPAYITIQPNKVRGLKTICSKRDIPLVGGALEAMKEVVAAYKTNSEYLLARYASDNRGNPKPRGADSLSAMINKRFDAKGYPMVTTHSFRHSLKDLFRNSGVPESLGNEITGHGKATISRGYGLGTSLEVKAEALKNAYALIS